MKNPENNTSEQFYDKAIDWVILKGPNILIGLVLLFIGMWLIRVFSRWIRKRLVRKDMDPSVKPFFISLSVTALRILLIFTVMQSRSRI